jgi:transposase
MPFQGVSVMEQRMLFIAAAGREDANIRELCREHGVSPTTAYKWLERTRMDGLAGLYERSRRPHGSPRRTPGVVEAAVVGVRHEHPCWGGRKIHRVLAWQGLRVFLIPTRSPASFIVMA